MKSTILIVDDETAILDTLQILLRGEGFEVAVATSGQDAIERWDQLRPDLVLSDIRMPGMSGIDLLSAVRERDPDLPVILMTAQASLQSAMQAVNQGAFYYLQKPFKNAELLALCRRATESHHLKRENRELRREIHRRDSGRAQRPVGSHRSFLDVVKLAETVAPTDSTVLITGESGTGKEVVARYIHALSEREGGPFISVNCGALPETLLESELFGHVKGSFTGAVRDKQGLLVAATGGTFFLDEVGEMSPALQVKLLRTLQEREVVPVGATASVPTDVRVIAATNRDLDQEIRRGHFRSDLYYRLNVITLHIPPLRERGEDVLLLADHFLGTHGRERGRDLSLGDDVAAALLRYDWPGNVRELENALERAAVISGGDRLDIESLPARVAEPQPAALVTAEPPANPTLEVIERAYILWVLGAEGGNKSRAAEVLGIDPSTLYRKLNRYGVEG
jgi:DNA-binding NtrC family response regulator